MSDLLELAELFNRYAAMSNGQHQQFILAIKGEFDQCTSITLKNIQKFLRDAAPHLGYPKSAYALADEIELYLNEDYEVRGDNWLDEYFDSYENSYHDYE